MVATAKGAGITYSLEVERGGKRSDHGCDYRGTKDDVPPGDGEGGMRSDHDCDCNGSRDDIQSGGGDGGQEVRSWLQLQREQGRCTVWRWRGGPRGQITVVIVKGAREMYSLEVEGEGKRSEHGCDCKGGNIQSGG